MVVAASVVHHWKPLGKPKTMAPKFWSGPPGGGQKLEIFVTSTVLIQSISCDHFKDSSRREKDDGDKIFGRDPTGGDSESKIC